MTNDAKSGSSKKLNEPKRRTADKKDLLKGPQENRVMYDLEILRSLRSIVRSIAKHSQKLNVNHNITVPQSICLLTVSQKGPLTATEISKNIHVSPSTIVGILDRLEKKDLIKRDRSSKDRRRVMVTITKNGLDVVKNAPSPMQDLLTEALNRLPEIEQAAISLSLKKIIDLLKEKDIHVDDGGLPILDHSDE